jgi:hypothetical protein
MGRKACCCDVTPKSAMMKRMALLGSDEPMVVLTMRNMVHSTMENFLHCSAVSHTTDHWRRSRIGTTLVTDSGEVVRVFRVVLLP